MKNNDIQFLQFFRGLLKRLIRTTIMFQLGNQSVVGTVAYIKITFCGFLISERRYIRLDRPVKGVFWQEIAYRPSDEPKSVDSILDQRLLTEVRNV